MRVIIMLERGVSPFSVVKVIRATYSALPDVQVYITRDDKERGFGWEFQAVSALDAIREQEKEGSSESS